MRRTVSRDGNVVTVAYTTYVYLPIATFAARINHSSSRAALSCAIFLLRHTSILWAAFSLWLCVRERNSVTATHLAGAELSCIAVMSFMIKHTLLRMYVQARFAMPDPEASQ